MRSLPIKYKLFVLLFGLTAGVVAVILFATNRTVSESVREGVVENFSRTQTFLTQQQRLRYDRLVESAYLISENSTFKANLALDDPPTMTQSVRRFSRFVKTDLMIVTNRKGQVLSWLGAPGKTGTDLMHRAGVRAALAGTEPPLKIRLPTLWAIEGALYQVVTIPVYSGGGIIGTLTLGAQFTEVEAANLRTDSTMQVSMFLDRQRIASTLPDTASGPYQALWSDFSDRVDRVIREREPTDPFRLSVGGGEHFAVLSPLGEGEPAFYVASVPVATELSTLYSLRWNILLIAVVAAALTVPLAVVLGGIVSGPIETLSAAMDRVEQDGDLDVQVDVQSGDELGALARNFNEMIADLRERSLLQRHVGKHTLEMIQDREDVEIDLNDQGQMQNLAVVFTDLRGSTGQIERTAPREFVRQLNRTFSTQARIATHFGGSIDKFVGDAMIAIFAGEAPLERALECCVEIQRGFRVDPLSSAFWDGLGVGVNYGPMLMGTMGAEERLDYSVIGAEVNLCARLCSAAAPGQILVRRDLLEQHGLSDPFPAEPVGEQTFKGFDRHFEIAELLYDTDR
jgi:class 3 adenylate cyclase